MALYLVRAKPLSETRNMRINGYIVDAANESGARAAALAAARNGEALPKSTWQAVPLADVVPVAVAGLVFVNGEPLNSD